MNRWIPLAPHRAELPRIGLSGVIPDFLPKPGQRILFYVNNKSGWRRPPRCPLMLIGRLCVDRSASRVYVRTEKQGILDFYGEYELLEIDYWMPAPEPPGELEQE